MGHWSPRTGHSPTHLRRGPCHQRSAERLGPPAFLRKQFLVFLKLNLIDHCGEGAGVIEKALSFFPVKISCVLEVDFNVDLKRDVVN